MRQLLSRKKGFTQKTGEDLMQVFDRKAVRGIVLAILLLSCADLTLAETADSGSEAGEAPTTPSSPPIPNSGGGGIKEDSTNMMMQSLVNAGMNVASGSLMYSQYTACVASSTGGTGHCTPLAIMAVMNFAQAGLGVAAAGKARNTRNSVDPTNVAAWKPTDFPKIEFPEFKPNAYENLGPVPGSFQPGDFDANRLLDSSTPEGTNMTLPPGVQKAQDLLTTAGFKIDEKTGVVTTPDGLQVSASDLGSSTAMAAAGMTPEQIASLQAAQSAVDNQLNPIAENAARVLAMGVETGGGGGVGGAGAAAGFNLDDLDAGALDDPNGSLTSYLKKLQQGQKGSEKDRMIAGKSVKFGGDPIGIQQDNIFEIVHRRYTSKKKLKNFID